ncbi:BBSome complex member BBS2-like isoform X2 [Styela clava]
MKPAFNFKLNHKVHPGTLTIGKYDGIHSCLTAATTAGKIIIHNPYSSVTGGERVTIEGTNISLLNINQSITSVKAGSLDEHEGRDVLAVGTATNLLLYDVHNNKDLFYKEVPDGVNALEIGKLGDIEYPMVIAGGNCTLQGFDVGGEDKYWTVAGDNICALALVDFTNNGKKELIVGSEDFDIRVFQEDEIISEVSENDTVTGLSPISGSRFAYTLANGTVGVYDRTARYWRVKSKSQVMAIHYFDINGEGEPELITGWSSGKIDVRNTKTGNVLYKDTMSSAIAGIVDADYRMDGQNQLICVSVDGEVRGYDPIIGKTSEAALNADQVQEQIRDLSQQKQSLLLELQNFEQAKLSEKSSMLLSPTEKTQAGMIPISTELKTKLSIDGGSENQRPHIKLTVYTTNNDVIIRLVTVFAEGIFDGESFVVHPPSNQISNMIDVPLSPLKDTEVELHIKAYVGPRNSQSFHVFEVARKLPRFAMYSYMPTSLPEPQGYVTFSISDRITRILIWLNENFLILDADGDPINLLPDNEDQDFSVNFLLLRGGGPLILNFAVGGQVTINTDDIDLAGDVIQSITSFLGIEHLQVTADFPGHFQELHGLIEKAGEMHTTQQRLTAEMSDHSNLIRSLVVRAEDSRLMGDHTNMRRGYSELYSLNQDLVNGYHIRCSNHTELLECLRQVNKGIQRAGNLRVGKHKTGVVNGCREAVKKSDASALVRIMKAGSN